MFGAGSGLATPAQVTVVTRSHLPHHAWLGHCTDGPQYLEVIMHFPGKQPVPFWVAQAAFLSQFRCWTFVFSLPPQGYASDVLEVHSVPGVSFCSRWGLAHPDHLVAAVCAASICAQCLNAPRVWLSIHQGISTGICFKWMLAAH